MTDEDRVPQRNRDEGWPPQYATPADDEISLFDLWLVLVRRRWLMVLIFAAVVVAGLAYALTRPTVYEYSAIFSIGEVFRSEGEETGLVLAPVQSPEGVVAEIRSVREPAAVREIVGDPSDGGYTPSIDASSPEGSNIVILSGVTTTDNADRLKRTMEIIAERTRESHAARIGAARKRIQGEVKTAENELERLSARKESLNQELTDLDQRVESLEKRRDELDQELRALRQQRSQEGETISGNSLMTLNSQIASLRSDLQQIYQQINDQIPEERREARLALNNVRSEIDDQKRRIDVAEASLNDITPTRLSSQPQRALNPTGTNSRLILALAIVLGAMLAVFAAFVWEFITRANAYVREQGTTS